MSDLERAMGTTPPAAAPAAPAKPKRKPRPKRAAPAKKKPKRKPRPKRAAAAVPAKRGRGRPAGGGGLTMKLEDAMQLATMVHRTDMQLFQAIVSELNKKGRRSRSRILTALGKVFGA